VTDSADDRFRKTYPVSWQELHRDAKALAWRLMEGGPWKGIIGIARGGLVPATIVARELEIRLVDTVCVVSYDHQAQSDASVLKAPQLEDGGRGWLVVDDLVDTGQTARKVHELWPNVHLATIFAKPAGRPEVDTFVTEVSQDTWIYFPWDTDISFVQPIAGSRQRD